LPTNRQYQCGVHHPKLKFAQNLIQIRAAKKQSSTIDVNMAYTCAQDTMKNLEAQELDTVPSNVSWNDKVTSNHNLEKVVKNGPKINNQKTLNNALKLRFHLQSFIANNIIYACDCHFNHSNLLGNNYFYSPVNLVNSKLTYFQIASKVLNIP